MKCHQCSNMAMYRVEEQQIPLCLNCYYKFAQINQQNLENQERLFNLASDNLDMSLGINLGSPRFPPRPKALHIGDVKLNNISVNNSVIGTINTGSIGSLDQSISALIQLNESGIANAFKELSEAIIKSQDLTPNQKNELIESLNIISREAASPKEYRQKIVSLSLLERAEKITSLANDISEICQRCIPLITALFA